MMEKEREVVELFEAAKKAADAAAVDSVSSNGAEVARCVDALKQLKSFPITYDVLLSSQVGKRLRSLTKHSKEKIQSMALEVFEIWKKIAIEESQRKKNGVTDGKSSTKAETPVKGKSENVQSASSIASKNEVKPVVTKAVNVKTEEKQVSNGKKSQQELAPPKLGAMIKCNDALRDKVRELLAEALSKVYSEVDEDLREEVSKCDPVRVAVSVESAMFEKMGRSNGPQKFKYRSIMFNIKDQNNPDLRRKVLLGQVKPEKLIMMTPEEMASKQRQLENQQIKEKALFDCQRGGPPKATTDQFKCGRCGQRKCTYHQMQTRSADEPMTTYVTCVNCNNHWKFC